MTVRSCLIVAACWLAGGASGMVGGVPGPRGETVKALRFASGGPEELAFDDAGHLYGADCQDAFVFRVRGQHSMSIVAGTGVQGFRVTADPL